MSKDLKSFIKNSKSDLKQKHVEKMAKKLADKNPQELSQQFAKMLEKSKQNGTFNKPEMLQMLSSIRNNMSEADYNKIKNIINNL